MKRLQIEPSIKINGIELAKYRTHPRVLELRLISIHHKISRAYDLNTATEFFRSLCGVFKCNWQIISGILANHFNIRRLSKLDKMRFRQEMIFMGLVYGETRYYIAKELLNITQKTMYAKSNKTKPEDYINQKWLDGLDKNVTVCGVDTYRLEAERFVESYNYFLEAVGNVSLSKV